MENFNRNQELHIQRENDLAQQLEVEKQRVLLLLVRRCLLNESLLVLL
jgi:hypothetical protein